MRALKRMLLVMVAGMLLLPAVASAAPPPVGGVTQLPGTLGCFSSDGSSQDGAGTCQTARGLEGAESVTVSPDGKFVYVGSYEASGQSSSVPGLAVFSRNAATGQLTQLPGRAGCLTADGSSQAGPGTCTAVVALGPGDGHDFVITSDGRWAYMVNSLFGHAAIVLFSRDPASGILTQLPGTAGCITADGSSDSGPNTCQAISTLGDPFGLSLSPDDGEVYVTDAGRPYRVHVLARDPSSGALHEVQCLAEATLTGCTTVRDIGNDMALIVSPDGLHAYSSDFTNSGISVFDRDRHTGVLTQKDGAAGCISDTGADDTGAATCTVGRELSDAYAFSISPTGNTLYVDAYGAGTNADQGGVALFHVEGDGSLMQLSGVAGCLTVNGNDNTGAPTCSSARALTLPYGNAISPDGRTLYVTEQPNPSAAGGIVSLSLDPTTGAATQMPGAAGCTTVDGSSNGTPGLCARGRALAHAYSAAVSPDGTSLYVASFNGQSITAFTRETGPACTGTSASIAYGTPVTVTLTCTDADGDPLTRSILTGPAHGTVGTTGSTVTYTPAGGYTGADSFTFDASDGTNTSAPVTATIAVGAAPVPPAHGITLPKITNATQSHRRWRETRHGGTTFTVTLNEPASVTFTFTPNGHKRALGKITVTDHAGRNKLTFNGRINPHLRLKPGTYTVTIKAGTSTHRLIFTIVN